MTRRGLLAGLAANVTSFHHDRSVSLLTEVKLTDAKLTEVKLTEAKLTAVMLTEVKLIKAKLTEV